MLRVSRCVLRLLEDQRDLLDGGGHEQRVGAGRLDLGELRGHVRGRRLHGFHGADLDAVCLEHLAEVLGRAAAPVVVDGEEVRLLDAERLTIGLANAFASTATVGLMRKMYGLPDVVILPDEEVSTSIGTLYSSSFGMTASVSVELHAPIITGTLSRTISFSAAAAASVGLDLLSSIDQLDLLAEHAAGFA